MKLDPRKRNGKTWSGHQWPEEIPSAPPNCIELVECALRDFGPDGHTDGAYEIAAIMLAYFQGEL